MSRPTTHRLTHAGALALLSALAIACRDEVADHAAPTSPEMVLRRAAATYSSVPSTLADILVLPSSCPPPSGSFPGPSCYPPGSAAPGLSLAGGRAINWSAVSVNDDPRAARYLWGNSGGGTGFPHAVRGINLLPESPGACGSIALGINDRGDAVGSMLLPTSGNNGSCFPFTPRAALWPASGGIVDLGTAVAGRGSEAYAINNAGAIVGRASTGAPSSFMYPGVPVRFSGGTVTPLDASGCPGVAFAINASGQAVGVSCNAAALWSGNQRTVLPVAAGATESVARGINDAGDVVGAITFPGPGPGPLTFNTFYQYTDGPVLGFRSGYGAPALWRGGALTVLQFMPGAVPLGAIAEDVNEYGQVIGYAVTDGRFAKVQWQVPNPYPALALNAVGATTITAGQSVSLALRFSDPTPNAAAWSLRVDWGDGTAPYVASSSAQLIAFPVTRAHQYTTRGAFTATYTVTSKTGYSNSATIPITVN